MNRILFVIDVMRKGGGAQKVLAMLLPMLQSKGFIVELVVLKKTEQLLEIVGVKTYYVLECEKEALLPNTFCVLDKLVGLLRGFDLVCSFMDFITSYFVALAAKVSQTPYYNFVRCEPSFVAETFPQARINKELYALCLKGAQKVVCNSKSSCLDVEKNFNVAKQNIYLLQNPINAQQILEQSEMGLGEMEALFCDDSVFCVSVGRLHPQKNYTTLLKAFLELKDSKIKLILLGDGEQRGELEDFIAQHQMQNVFLLGYQSNIYPFLKRADIFVHCAFYEGFPNGVLEAAFLKKPLILSDISTHREIFNTESAQFFMPKDFKHLADLILFVAFDVKERTRLSKEAERIMRKYQKESFEKKLEKLFHWENLHRMRNAQTPLGKPSDNAQCTLKD